MTSTRPIILCFVAYYLPGYRSGGPVRTIANFVEHLGGEFDIRIVTRDRDALDTVPYPSVKVDEWNQVGAARVFYASKKTLTLGGVAKLIRDTEHDVLYLNSFFAFEFTCLPLLARRLGMAPRTRCVIAPRGEFSQGAIALKAVKKRMYMTGAKFLGLYSNLKWQASSELEALNIQREWDVQRTQVFVASDLPSLPTTPDQLPSERKSGPLRIIFLSRISPMKNLDFLLRVLSKAEFNVDLYIFGPKENAQYWETCKHLIDCFPVSIQVKLSGEIDHNEVAGELAKYDLFVLPTRGENFGHVIFEALSAATPVLISDQTPWQQDGTSAVTVLPLDEDLWGAEIRRWANKSELDLLDSRKKAFAYANAYVKNSPALTQNRLLFSGLAIGEEDT